jgi:hypothetical protein
MDYMQDELPLGELEVNTADNPDITLLDGTGDIRILQRFKNIIDSLSRVNVDRLKPSSIYEIAKSTKIYFDMYQELKKAYKIDDKI